MRKSIYTIIAILLFHGFSSVAVTKKVLFIGNSYTYTNNMPGIVDSIASSFGDTLIFDMYAPGGYTLQQHSTDATTISKIFSQQWDIVVMHDQSEEPAFPPAQVATDVYPYARALDSMVHANDSCTQTMFMMTWGHANGDPANCATYPVICTYDGMQERLRESYLQMATDNHADVIPVGSAFKIMMDSAYSPWLYIADSSHPLVPGSYLEACVIYSSIYHKSTRGCTYTVGIPAANASLLQRIATKVVFDSLNLWQSTGHYPYAGFSNNNYSTVISFTSHPTINAHHYWSFGDGGHDTVANPSHGYPLGIFIARHTVTTDCFTETMFDTIYSPESVATYTKQADIIKIMQQSGGKVAFELLKDNYNSMEVFDSKGSLVRRYVIQNMLFMDTFVPGLYIYRLHSAKDNDIVIGNLGVY